MKRKLLIIPVMIITILVSCIPLTAAADGDPDYAAAFASLVENDTYNKGSYLYCRSGSTYFFVKGIYDHQLPQSQSGGVYAWRSKSGSRGNNIYRGSNYLMTTWDVSAYVTEVTYDDNLHTLSIVDTSNGNWQNTYYNIELLGLIYNNEVIYSGVDDSMHVSVTFNPNLSGEIDRATTLANGVVTYDDLFNFNVVNDSSFGIQWYMAIVEQGTSVAFLDPASEFRGADLTIYDNNIKYIYLYQEDVYLNDDPSYLPARAQSSMHLVGAQSESGINLVKWDMLNLQKNHNYDVVVYAVRNDADRVSFVKSGSTIYQSLIADTVDFTAIEEVYRSTFRLKNPAAYDANSKIGGAIANDSDTDIDDLTKNLYSYTDFENGNETLWGNYKYGSDVGSYDSSYFSSSGSGKFTTLLTETSSVFNFFSSVLRMMPGQFLLIFQLGFFALIIIAIVKKVT